MSKKEFSPLANPLFREIRELIEQSRQQVAIAVNSAMSMLYWQVGKRINEEVGYKDRSETYGKEIVATLWRQLLEEYGASFSEKNLRRMMQFASVFPDERIVVSLIRQKLVTYKNSDPYTSRIKKKFLYRNVQIGKVECSHISRTHQLNAV